MIYTSYYSNYRNFISGFKIVRISLWPPKYKYDVRIDKVALELTPSSKLLLAMKEKRITRQQYDDYFNNQLCKLNSVDVANRYNDSVMICYEKPSDHCHRHLVRRWLNDNGIECEELPNPSHRKSYV